MNFAYLSSTVSVKTVSEEPKRGIFEIEGLFAGYGLTIGNALRRVLLSSLPGAAVTQIKIKNVSHEFSTLPGVKEDIVEVSLNFKKIRFQLTSDETQILNLKVKGEKTVTAGDIELNSEVKIINPDQVIANLTSKTAELEVEVYVQRGLSYSAVESRKEEKLAIGTIAIDALFSPVLRVGYNIENMRVGDRTDYNRLRLEIETDGTISPSAALHKSANILNDHFKAISGIEAKEFDIETTSQESKPKRKRATKPGKEN